MRLTIGLVGEGAVAMRPLEQHEIEQLKVIAMGGSAAQQRRARLILLANQGVRPADIGGQVGLSRQRVYHWLRQFRLRRMDIFQPGVPAQAEPASVESGTSTAPITLDELVAQHGLDPERGRRVSETAGAIFDTTVDFHQLEESRRPLLEAAGRLYGLDSERILARPLVGYTEGEQVLVAAVAAGLRKTALGDGGSLLEGLSPATRHDIQVLRRMLRVAALLGDAEVEYVLAGRRQLEMHVWGRVKKPQRAQKAWNNLFGQDLVIISSLDRSSSTELREGPAVAPEDRFDQAVRKILIYYLDQIQLAATSMVESQAADEAAALQGVVRSARYVFRNMGEQFDVTVVAPVPRQLRWLSKNSGPVRRWHSLHSQIEEYLSTAGERRTAGLEALLQSWSLQRNQALEELLRALGSARYADFESVVRKLTQTERAGIFGPTTVRRPLGSILPGVIWDQYQQIRLLDIDWFKSKRVRELRRQVRTLYYLLAHFQAALGLTGANCSQTLMVLDEYLTLQNDIALAIDASLDYAKTAGPGQPTAGIQAFVDTKRAEQDELLARLPAVWEQVTSQRFRHDLGCAVAEL
jgi:CHAD domain-containing protein